MNSWNPQDPAVLQDQRRAYDEMRGRCPVAHSEALGWSLFSQGDVTAVTRDPVAFSSATKRLAIPNGMDPPEHTAYRSPLEPYFRTDRLASFEPRSRQIARDLLRPMIERAEVEAIHDFVDPFAHQALCAFMGWPVEDWNRISGWTHGNQDAALRHDREAGARLAREFADYVTGILRTRRSEASSGDLMGDLAQTRVHDKALSDDQIVSLLRTWTAGHGTVAAALGIVIRYLAGDHELQASLRARPDLLGAAIWEILRADGPLVANNRMTTRDVEIGGQTIRAGERISLMWMPPTVIQQCSPIPIAWSSIAIEVETSCSVRASIAAWANRSRCSTCGSALRNCSEASPVSRSIRRMPRSGTCFQATG